MKKVVVFIVFALVVLMFTPFVFSDVFLAPDGTGTYVGGLPNLLPNGAYVGGTPTLTPDGIYIDGIPKKRNTFKNWKQKRKIDN